MITRRVFVAMLLTVLCLAEAEGVLTGDKLDRRRVLVAREGEEAKAMVAVDRIQTMTVIGRTALVDSQAQGEPSDSLIAREVAALDRWPHPPFGNIEDRRLRVLAKVASGTASSVIFTVIAFGGLGEVLLDGSYSDDGLEGVGLLFISSYVGTMVGFPLGVTAVDPYDSRRKTFLGSAGTALGGIVLIAAGAMMGSETLANLGLMASFVAPPIVSIAVSEQSRKPPQSRRVSFGLSPTLNGGLSTSVTLRF